MHDKGCLHAGAFGALTWSPILSTMWSGVCSPGWHGGGGTSAGVWAGFSAVFKVAWLTMRAEWGLVLWGISVERVVVQDVERGGGGDHGESPVRVLGGGVQAGPALRRAPRGDRLSILRGRGCREWKRIKQMFWRLLIHITNSIITWPSRCRDFWLHSPACSLLWLRTTPPTATEHSANPIFNGIMMEDGGRARNQGAIKPETS